MRRFVFAVLLLLLGFVGGVVWNNSRESSGADAGPAAQPPSLSTQAASKDVSYSNVHLMRDDIGWFDGTVDVRNGTAKPVTVMVTVHAYSGQQNIGDLTGQVTLKPTSTSAVDLKSTDEYASFTDTTVELLPVPTS